MQDAGSQIHAERPCDGKHNEAARQIFKGETADFCDGEYIADKIELNSSDGDFSNQRGNGSANGLVHGNQEEVEQEVDDSAADNGDCQFVLLICRHHVLNAGDVAESNGDDEAAENLHKWYDFVVARSEEPWHEVVADGDKATEHGNSQEPDKAIGAHHIGLDRLDFVMGIGISNARQHDRAKGCYDGQGELYDLFSLLVIAVFQRGASHDANHCLVENGINLNGDLRQEHLDDDEEVAERLDFLQFDRMQVFRQIKPDGESGEDVHHAD